MNQTHRGSQDPDPLNIMKNNRRSRSRRRGRVSAKEIARFNLMQGSFPEKSRQWIDPNCPPFSQTVDNPHIYGSRESSTQSNPIKSRRKHKQKKKKKHKKKKGKDKINIVNKSKQKQNQFLHEIRTALTKQEWNTFSETTKVLHNELAKSTDCKQFEQSVWNPLVVLFNTNKRRKLLIKLLSIMPPHFKPFYRKKLEEINRKRSNYVVDLCSKTQETLLSYADDDWRCSRCSIENISQTTQCDLCGTLREEYRMDFTLRSMITVNGYNLDKLSAPHSNKLEQRLERLRHKLKRDYNIRQLHHVFSAPVGRELSEYAPINMEQLSYFEITEKKIKKYGVEIVNVIKEYLHENGLVSPFLKGSQMTLKERRDNVERVHCVYCRNLFAENVRPQHEAECVMRPKEVIVISDDEEEKEKKNEESDINMNGENDVNMNGIEDEDNDNKDNMSDTDYFDGMDDAVFTQMIEDENERVNKENDEMDLDTTGFVDDNALLECLERTEQQIRVKKEIKNELEQKRLELNAMEIRENEIKQQRLRLQQQVRVLDAKLRNFNA